LRKEPVHFRARQLALHGRRAFARQGVDLKIVLGEINANSDKCPRTVSLIVALLATTLWHFDAVEERPSTSSDSAG
jgi:hypothetical protein